VVVQASPLILCPILVLAVYFFMRETDSSGWTALFAMFLTVSSFQVTVGMFAFYLANWMALIELFLFMGLYLGSLRKKSWPRIGAMVLLSILMLFTHSWTWGMAMGAIILYLILMVAFKRKRLMKENRVEVQILILLIVTNGLVGIARNYALGLSAGSFETVRAAQSTVSVGALGSFWDSLVFTFMQGMDGFFVNSIALFLAVVGGFIIALGDRPVNRFLTSWLIVSSIAFVLSSGWTMKSRILFDTPFQVFEALGLIGVSRAVGRVSEPTVNPSLKLMIILFVMLATLNYAFRCAFVVS
jgi:hypothetical protein